MKTAKSWQVFELTAGSGVEDIFNLVIVFELDTAGRGMFCCVDSEFREVIAHAVSKGGRKTIRTDVIKPMDEGIKIGGFSIRVCAVVGVGFNLYLVCDFEFNSEFSVRC